MNKIEFKTIVNVLGLKKDSSSDIEEYYFNNVKLHYDGFYYVVLNGFFSKELIDKIEEYKHIYNIIWKDIYPYNNIVSRISVSTNNGLIFLINEINKLNNKGNIIDVEKVYGEVNRRLINLADLNTDSNQLLKQNDMHNIILLKQKEKNNTLRTLLEEFEYMVNPFSLNTEELVDYSSFYDNLLISYEINDERKRITIQDKKNLRNYAVFIRTKGIILYSLYYLKDDYYNVIKHVYKLKKQEKEKLIIESYDVSHTAFGDYDKYIKYDLTNNEFFDDDFVIEKLSEALEVGNDIMKNIIKSKRKILEKK